MKLIGLSGYAQAGKDTVGEILVRNYGFTRVSFADKLREAAEVLNPCFGWTSGMDPSLDSCVSLKDLLVNGWEEAKKFPAVRSFLQRLGTEVGRNLLGENVWVDAALNGLDPRGKYVVTDVRFPNEFHAISDKGGEVWRIHRQGTKPVNDHPSETALDAYSFNRCVFNDGTLETLEIVVDLKLGEFEAVHELAIAPMPMPEPLPRMRVDG